MNYLNRKLEISNTFMINYTVWH